MNLKKNSLKVKVWLYLILFSVIILSFLWLFQVIFLKPFYENHKIKTLNNVASKINSEFNSDNYEEKLDLLAHDNGVCIEIISNNIPIYLSNSFNKGCMIENSNKYKFDFTTSNLNKQTYEIINPRFNNKTLVYALKLNNGYAFISASLEPLDDTINLLKKQLFYVTILVLILGFLIAYFISRKISEPIEKINNKAKKMADGNFNIDFNNISDIEEINQLADTLNYTKSELEKTDELRRELLANVSHDLKTPLTMIKAYAEMVRDLTYNNPDKRNNNLNVIIEESERLNTLVNDILILSKIQSKTNELDKTEFDLVELINSILTRYDILVTKENYQFIFNHPDNVIIKADKKRIEQVIYNLVNNAINYTGEEKIVTINITKHKECYKIEIIDTGKGIDKKDIPFIWDKYYHTDKNHQRNIVGTGLGLSIVKNILISHNFQYGVNSIKNKGTTFYFIIPIS